MGSDVNTVRETSSARAMGVAIASGDRRGFFCFARSMAEWDVWARTAGEDGSRRCDARRGRPETRERGFFYVGDACASRRRGE